MRHLWCLVFVVVLYVNATKLTKAENRRVQRKCGHYLGGDNDAKILRGTLANYTDVPSVVTLSYFDALDPLPEYEAPAHCSGTLISPRHVLTAGHCIGVRAAICPERGFSGPTSYKKDIPADWTVYLRINSLYLPLQDQMDWNPVKIKVKQMFHPHGMDMGICHGTDYGDIAVFELEEDVPYTEDTTYACLPEERIPINRALMMYGYGADPADESPYFGGVLKTYSVTTCECNDTSTSMPKDRICAMSDDQRIACSGDSGSGYVRTRENGQTEVVTILVSGPDCEKVHGHYINGTLLGVPLQDTMVDVHHHIPWICNATGICPPTFSSYERESLPNERTDFVVVRNVVTGPMEEMVEEYRRESGDEGEDIAPEVPDPLEEYEDEGEEDDEEEEYSSIDE